MAYVIQNLFDLTQEECLGLARRSMVECIHSIARIAGIAATFPEVREICEGRTVAGLTIDDTNKIYNLKRAWQFMLETIDYPLDILYLKQINQIVNTALMPDAGRKIRGYDVRIGGISWRPDIPDTGTVQAELARITDIPCITERAINAMLYIMRAQIFSDGNKRVAQLAANQILIQNGKGYLLIPEENNKEFFDLLLRFYETNDSGEITSFLLRTSICGKKVIKQQEDMPISEDMFKAKEKTQGPKL